MVNFWNQRYEASEYAYGTVPNSFFQQALVDLPPGKMLLPGEGEGRNAVYAAGLGWQVRAMDFSETGRRKALDLAQAHGVSIDYEVTDLETYIPEPGMYHALGLVFVHLPAPLRSAVHQRCIDALRTGGQLILEAFTPRQLQYSSGGPRDPAMLYTVELLREDFSCMDILLLEELVVTLREGSFHEGEAAVVRLIAVKRNGGND